jgi:hypothetical protein
MFEATIGEGASLSPQIVEVVFLDSGQSDPQELPGRAAGLLR